MKNNNGFFFFSTDFFIPLLFLLQLVPQIRAQSSSSPPPPDAYSYANFNPSIVTIIVILVAALFLMGFFSIYIRRRSNDGSGGISIRRALSLRRTTAASRGLDAAVIETFPTFVYSTVKGLKIGKGALECAVCLNEYEDEETLRLIPKCDHVFHPDCIDAWFESHVTCPVCRANLVPVSGEIAAAGVGGQPELGEDENENENDVVPVPVSVSISIAEENPAVNGAEPAVQVLDRNQTVKTNRSVRGIPIPRMFDKFRSHSTGHSLVQPGENLDRFTLRLPEDVRKQVVNRALLNRTGTGNGTGVRLAGEGSEKKGYRTAGAGAASGRRKSYKRLESLETVGVRSERWVLSRAPSFLTRALAVMSPRVVSGNGEASASTSSTAGDKIPLNNLGPKSC